MLNVFNERNVLNRNNDINLGGFDVSDSTYGLITPAQQTACETSGDNQPCLIAGYKKFQVSGAPLIATAASGVTNHNPLYKLADTFQGRRELRFGFRLLF